MLGDNIYDQAAGYPPIQEKGKPKKHNFFTYCGCEYCMSHNEFEGDILEDPKAYERLKGLKTL